MVSRVGTLILKCVKERFLIGYLKPNLKNSNCCKNGYIKVILINKLYQDGLGRYVVAKCSSMHFYKNFDLLG